MEQNKQEFLNFIKKQDAYNEIARKRLKDIFQTIRGIIKPFPYDLDLCKKFPEIYQFYSGQMSQLDEFYSRGDGIIGIYNLNSKYIVFYYCLSLNDEKYISVNSIIAYANEQEFSDYLKEVVKQCKSLNKFIERKYKPKKINKTAMTNKGK